MKYLVFKYYLKMYLALKYFHTDFAELGLTRAAGGRQLYWAQDTMRFVTQAHVAVLQRRQYLSVGT